MKKIFTLTLLLAAPLSYAGEFSPKLHVDTEKTEDVFPCAALKKDIDRIEQAPKMAELRLPSYASLVTKINELQKQLAAEKATNQILVAQIADLKKQCAATTQVTEPATETGKSNGTWDGLAGITVHFRPLKHYSYQD